MLLMTFRTWVTLCLLSILNACGAAKPPAPPPKSTQTIDSSVDAGTWGDHQDAEEQDPARESVDSAGSVTGTVGEDDATPQTGTPSEPEPETKPEPRPEPDTPPSSDPAPDTPTSDSGTTLPPVPRDMESCDTPAGMVKHNENAVRTRYKQPAVPFGQTCDDHRQVQMALCTNGTLGPYIPDSFLHETCVVEDALRVAAAIQYGDRVMDGEGTIRQNFTLSIRILSGSAEAIGQVNYRLHSTYSPDNTTVTSSAGGFATGELNTYADNWRLGDITVFLKDGTSLTLEGSTIAWPP